jgi:hypothetical protein
LLKCMFNFVSELVYPYISITDGSAWN